MGEHIRLDELIEDLAVYPRGSVSDVRVADLAYALDAGSTLPPPVIDRATRKIIDGFHRVRAYRKRLGDDGMIECDVREFAGEAEMLLESARINAVQGLPLGRYDQRIVHIRARQLGAGDEEIARALRVTPARLKQVKLQIINSADGPVAGKADVARAVGSNYLTPEQVAEIRRMRGAPAKSKVTELTRLLQQGLTPVNSDPDLRTALALLASVIEGVLQSYATAE